MCSILNAISELDLPTQNRVWIAFSGGLDSTVLLHACVQVLGSTHCSAIHVNHQLSPSSEGWVEHCTRTAQQWGVMLIVDTVEVSIGNIEQQARVSRYATFRNRLDSEETLLTAHHRDDELETLFWQLFTGRAMIGIPRQRLLGLGAVLRPLLGVEKQELESYAKQHGLTWVEDESNTDTNLDRNWIRHELIPQLLRRFPQTKGRILELKQPALPEGTREPLKLRDKSLTIEEVRSWLLAYEVNPPTRVLKEILLQANAQADANPEIKVADGLNVCRYREQLYCVPLYEVFNPLQVTVGEPAKLSNGTLTWKEATEGFEKGCTLLCTNRVHLKGVQRVIKHGAIHKKLAKLFQESSIPPWLRDGWPVLCEGDTVLSLVDVRTDTASHKEKIKPTFLPSWNPID